MFPGQAAPTEFGLARIRHSIFMAQVGQARLALRGASRGPGRQAPRLAVLDPGSRAAEAALARGMKPSAQFEFRDGELQVHAAITLEAQGLQRERSVEAADQRVGTAAHADRRARGRADIGAGESAAAGVGRGEYRPAPPDRAGEAEIGAEAADSAGIALARPACSR